MATNLQSKLGLGLAQAQTANMDAAAYNRANASDPGRVQIEGGTAPGSQGAIGSQALSPASLSTPTTETAPTVSAQRTVATSSPTSTNPTVINNQKSTSGSAPIGSSPVGTKGEKVKSATIPTSTTLDGGTQGISTATPQPQLTLMQIRDQIKTSNPTMKPTDIMKQAREQFMAQRNVYNPATGNPPANTGIAPLDAELTKLRDEKAQKIKDTYKNYSLAQADYQKNAGYYTNFEGTNQTFNNVLNDIQNTLTNSKTGQLSDQEMAIIASKNGVSVDAVKNPLSIYSNLQMTDEGKQVLGITARENQMKDMETEKKRAEEDAKLQLERNTQQLNYQIDDAQKQLQRNVDWATASGAWSGAGRSSGYEQGIKNMRDDTATIINRINANISNMNADTSKYLNRLNDDFTTNMGRAKDSLDLDLKNLKFDSGLKLNGLDEKYGKNSKELLKALDAIQEEFGTKSLDSFNKYLTSVKSIQGITMDNINLMEKMNTVNQALANRRYGELTANNGALLQNISLSNIADEVKAGKMDMGKYADIRNLMISSVTNTLTSRGITVGAEDLNVITHLIDNGATPSQAIARIGGGNKTDVSIDPTSIANFSTQKRGRTNLQCGELTNDYWQQMTGKPISNDPSINTYNGKVNAVKKLGESPIPQVGGVFVLNTGTSAGHIGIVQQVNPDGSIVVLEANRNGSTSGGAPVLGKYSADTVKGMTFSKPPTDMMSQGEQTVTHGTKGTRPDRNNNPGNVKVENRNDALSIPGAVGVDDQNHIIFSNPTDGYNWMVRDLKMKLSGQSQWGLTPDSTLADLGKVYAEDPNWTNNVSQISGYSADTKLSQIDVNKLAPAIARQEGFSGTIKPSTQSQGAKSYTSFEKAGMDKFTTSLDPKDLKEVGVTKDDYNAYMAQKNAPETPNAMGYRLSDYTTRIRNMLPAGQADQPGEQAKIEKLAQQYIADGLTPEQASLKYLGFNIKDNNNTQLATQLRNAMQNLKTPPKGYEQKLSDMINAGKTQEAMNFVNANVDRDVKDMYGDKAILTQNFESSQNRINKIISLIQRNRDKVGAFDGRFTDFIKQFKNEPEYQELKTLQTMAQADIRKYFAGSAVTDTEMKALEDFIGGTTKMQPDNLITQLQTIQNDVKQNYGYQRQVYGLEGTPGAQSSSTPPQSQEATVDSIYNDIINL